MKSCAISKLACKQKMATITLNQHLWALGYWFLVNRYILSFPFEVFDHTSKDMARAHELQIMYYFYLAVERRTG
jgi:hypothetical protein